MDTGDVATPSADACMPFSVPYQGNAASKFVDVRWTTSKPSSTTTAVQLCVLRSMPK